MREIVFLINIFIFFLRSSLLNSSNDDGDDDDDENIDKWWVDKHIPNECRTTLCTFSPEPHEAHGRPV